MKHHVEQTFLVKLSLILWELLRNPILLMEKSVLFSEGKTNEQTQHDTGGRGGLTPVQRAGHPLLSWTNWRKEPQVLSTCVMAFKWTLQRERRTTLESWKEDIYLLTTVW